MEVKTLLADPAVLELECIRATDNTVTLIVKTMLPQAQCPDCHMVSMRIRSRCVRTVADLPWQGIAVKLELHIRHFFCQQEECPRHIFCERLPMVVEPYARRTIRLSRALELIGFAAGGETGARLAIKLGISVSPDTLLRQIRQTNVVTYPTPRVLGIDDWAWRRGQRYGMILVDLERRHPVDMLPDREADTLAAWLTTHPGVEIINRDRSGAYAEGASREAPSAVPVADRRRLLKNMVEAVERVISRHHEVLHEAGRIIKQMALSQSPSVLDAGPLVMLSSGEEWPSQQCHQARHARYSEVIRLHRQGLSILGIARSLRISRMTVYRYIRSGSYPEHVRRSHRGRALDRFVPSLHQRWAEGCHNALQLWREITEQGYGGPPAMVRRYIRRLRARLSALSLDKRDRVLSSETKFKTPTSRQAAWWLMRDEKTLTTDEQCSRRRGIGFAQTRLNPRPSIVSFNQ
jgi:transposase